MGCQDCWDVCNYETGEMNYQCISSATNFVCKPSCVCDQGYARDENGQCAPCYAKQCPTNEQYKECHDVCGPSCDPNCITNTGLQDCTPGCQCNPGLYRNADGVCVDPGACEPQDCSASDPNAYWEPCDGRCISYCDGNNEYVRECQDFNSGYSCHPQCACIAGFVMGPNNICETCSPVGECGPNEVYTDCQAQCGQNCDIHAECETDTTQCQPGND